MATSSQLVDDAPSRNARPTNQPPLIVEPADTHAYTLILLHGLGSNGHKFGQELLDTAVTSEGRRLQQLLPSARFIFPTSRWRRSTAYGRTLLTQWFDIANLDDPNFRKEIQLRGLAEEAKDLLSLIANETSSISPSNIILGGLSQGCAMSLSTLLCLDHPIGGFIGMSGWLPFQEDIEEAIQADDVDEAENPFADDTDKSNQASCDPAIVATIFERDLVCMIPLDSPTHETTACSTPVYLGHGALDDKVPSKLGEAAARAMRLVGYEVAWRCYSEQGHWYKIPEQIDDIVEFIRSRVGWHLASTKSVP